MTHRFSNSWYKDTPNRIFPKPKPGFNLERDVGPPPSIKDYAGKNDSILLNGKFYDLRGTK